MIIIIIYNLIQILRQRNRSLSLQVDARHMRLILMLYIFYIFAGAAEPMTPVD